MHDALIFWFVVGVVFCGLMAMASR